MRKRTVIFLLSWLFLFQFACSGDSQQNPEFIWQNLEIGPYAVGYKVEHVYDYSRTFKPRYDYERNPVQEEIARPIQITIWYPAVLENKDKQMTYGEYFMDEATETDFAQNTVEARERSLIRAKDFALGTDAIPDAVDAVYAERTSAYRDAQPLQGKFPLLLYSPSHSNSSSENVVLFEYLASHGFVIASCPGVGISTRGVKETAPEVETQTRDLEFVLARMRDFPSVDFNKIGVFGFSWGSIYTALLAQRNSKIGTVVSLDGSDGYRRWLEFIYGLPGFDPKKMRAYYMYLSSVPPAGIEDRHDHKFFNDCIYSDAFLIQFPEVHHVYFCSYYIKTYDVMSDEWKTGDDRERIFKGYETACRYLLNLFNASLNGDENSRNYLHNSPEENGIPEGSLFVDKRQGLKPPPTQSQFFEIIEEIGEEEAIRIYKEAKERDTSVVIFYESDMDALGHRLLKGGNTQKAIAVFKLNAEVYPESARVYGSLGDAYTKTGENDLAIQYFQRALKLDPESHSIKEKLAKLGIKN